MNDERKCLKCNKAVDEPSSLVVIHRDCLDGYGDAVYERGRQDAMQEVMTSLESLRSMQDALRARFRERLEETRKVSGR